MQIIVKCPQCGRHILVKAGGGFTSEIVLSETKICPGCSNSVDIDIKIKAKIQKPEKAEKS